MARTYWSGAILLALLALARTPGAEAASPLTADTMRMALRTANPDEVAYITYIATLLDQGRLPLDMVEAIFQWARRKPDSKRAQYFKHGLIAKAADIGITLPQGTPSLTGTIRGRAFARVLMIKVPAPGITVSLDGTNFSAVTDANGEFIFRKVPLGTYTLRASGTVALLARHATAVVMLPSAPPSDGPVTVHLKLQ